MSGDSSSGIDREILLYLVIGLVLVVPIAHALVFDATSEAGAEWEATPAGPTVYFDEDRSLPSGSPFPASNSVHIQTSSGSAYYNGTVDTRARIDVMNGTWSNVSQLDVTAGNLTINPEKMAPASVSGDATRFAFKGQATVNDNTVDAIIAGNGQATVTMQTDGNANTNYGLVDTQTNEGLAVGVADSTGEVVFDDADLSGTHEVRVEELGELSIREETAQHELITGADVTVRFFEEDGETVVETTDSDGDGKIDLTGLPVDEQFIAQVDASQHEQRTAIIQDLSQQETVFLLNDTATPGGVEKEFVISDQTGNFDGDSTEIIIKRAIDEGFYKTGGDFKYRTVAGDDVGADRSYIVTLQEDARYRISVRNNEGDVRQLGAFTPKVPGTTTLELQAVNVSATDQTDIKYNATLDRSTSPDRIVMQYNDTRDRTDTLFVEIHERGNRSNKLMQNTSYTGPLGSVSVTQSIPDTQNQTEWVVRVTGDRSEADDFRAVSPLSPQRGDIVGNVPTWLVSILSIGMIWVTAGLFSQLNGGVGAIAVAGEGAIFWFSGFAPPYLGAGVVVLSMVTAGLLFMNERGDGGL